MIGPVTGLGYTIAREETSASAGPSIWDTIVDRSFDLIQGRYGTPQGQYTRYDAQGRPTVVYNSPSGSTTPVFGATDLGANASLTARGTGNDGLSNTTLLIIGGVVLAAVFLMNRR